MHSTSFPCIDPSTSPPSKQACTTFSPSGSCSAEQHHATRPKSTQRASAALSRTRRRWKRLRFWQSSCRWLSWRIRRLRCVCMCVCVCFLCVCACVCVCERVCVCVCHKNMICASILHCRALLCVQCMPCKKISICLSSASTNTQVQAQWLARQYGFVLIASRCTSRLYQPAYQLVVSPKDKPKKIAVLTIRGNTQ